MIDDDSRAQLIAYREEQAKSTALEAEFLLNNDMLRGSLNLQSPYKRRLCHHL
jgi:hypothetical protein